LGKTGEAEFVCQDKRVAAKVRGKTRSEAGMSNT